MTDVIKGKKSPYKIH